MKKNLMTMKVTDINKHIMMEGIRVQTVISSPTQTHTGLYKLNNTKHYLLYILGHQNHYNNDDNNNNNNHKNNNYSNNSCSVRISPHFVVME